MGYQDVWGNAPNCIRSCWTAMGWYTTATPVVTPNQWWSLDRPKRYKVVMALHRKVSVRKTSSMVSILGIDGQTLSFDEALQSKGAQLWKLRLMGTILPLQ